MTKLSDPAFDTQITLRQSFHLLVKFLEQFNSRSPEQTDVLLSWLAIESDGGTMDPAQLDDFIQCAKTVLQPSA